MAKATLPTNFIDDILNSSMGSKRRFKMIQNSDGTVSFEDVSTYDQEGSTFGAAQINATNTAVNASADKSKIIDNADTLLATTATGYMAGAKAVAENLNELNSNLASLISFPDISKPITILSNGTTYTATENCWIIGKANGSAGIAFTYDGVLIGSFTSNSEHVLFYPLAKGHTININIAGTVSQNVIKAYKTL